MGKSVSLRLRLWRRIRVQYVCDRHRLWSTMEMRWCWLLFFQNTQRHVFRPIIYYIVSVAFYYVRITPRLQSGTVLVDPYFVTLIFVSSQFVSPLSGRHLCRLLRRILRLICGDTRSSRVIMGGIKWVSLEWEIWAPKWGEYGVWHMDGSLTFSVHIFMDYIVRKCIYFQWHL